MSDIAGGGSYIANESSAAEVSSTPVEVEQIPCCADLPHLSANGLDSDTTDYYDFNADHYSTMVMDNDTCTQEEFSQLRGKAPRRGRKLYECTAPECNKSYKKPAELTYHMDTVHLNLKWFTCIYKNCDKSFYYPAHMKRHLRTHGPKQFYCELCYSEFSRLENMKVHQRKCRLLLVCSVCGETFITNADIQKHRQSHCVYLKCLYKDCYEHLAPDNIREHLSQHINVVKCPLCAAMYLDQSNLEQHMLRDHKTEMCYTADYTSDVDVESWVRDMFSDLHNLEGDQGGGGGGGGGGVLPAVECGEERETAPPASRFGESSSAQEIAQDDTAEPEKTSSDVKSPANSSTDAASKSEDPVLYRCKEPGCNYSTPTPRWLTKHTLKHRKKGAFKCKECGKVLADKWGLTLHMSAHTSNKDFPCLYCKKTFQTQSRLSQHCQNYHPESRVWKCDECQMNFSTSKRLMAHYRKHVMGEPLNKKL